MKHLYEKIQIVDVIADMQNRITIYKDFKVSTGLYSRKALNILDAVFASFRDKDVSLLVQNFFMKTPKIGLKPRYTFLNSTGEIYFVIRTDRTECYNAQNIEVFLMYNIFFEAYKKALSHSSGYFTPINISRLCNALTGYDDSMNDPPMAFTKPDNEVYEEYRDIFGYEFNPIQYSLFQNIDEERQQLAQKVADDNTPTDEVIRIYRRQAELYNDAISLCSD